MIFKILIAMIKEEYRLHSSMFGSLMFLTFPLLIGIGMFVMSLFIPYIRDVITIDQMVKLSHVIFILFGVSIGAFGLFGKEVMNRRFGQASLIAYSSRSLPVSERVIFFNFFIKDIIFYLFFWIAPIIIGFTLASFFISISFNSAIFFCGTLILSFLIGLSFVFFLSTIYAYSSKILIGMLMISITSLFVYSELFVKITNISLPSYLIFYTNSFTNFLLSLILIILPITISLLFLKVDYPESKKQYFNSLSDLSRKLQFSKHSFYIAKDFIDLKRSEGGIGKIIFSFLFPVGLTWIFLNFFLDLIPGIKAIMIFAIFLGIVSSSMYNMLTAFDTFNPYMFLPVNVSTIIKSKIMSYMLLNLLSFFIFFFSAISMNQLTFFIPALCSFITISIYSLTMTIFFTGLHPTILMYNSKIFSKYIITVAPFLFIFTILSIIQPMVLLLSLLLIPVAFIILKKSFVKWDNWAPINI